MKKRLFVATEVPASQIEDFTNYQKTLSINDATWTSKDNYHLTIAFLGYVNEENISAVEKEISQVAANFRPFQLHYESSILAPPGKNASMIWAKLAPSEEYSNLVGQMYSNIKPYITEQVRTERIPHITLARFREGVTINEKNLVQPQLREKLFMVKEISLFESKISPTGSDYNRLTTFTLGGL